MNKKVKFGLIFLAVTVVLNVGIRLLARLTDGFSEWYALNVYPLWVGSWGRLFGLAPVSVAEILLFALIVTSIVCLVVFIKQIKNGKGNRGKIFGGWALAVGCVVSFGFLVFLLNCEVNYSRETFLSQREKSLSQAEIHGVYKQFTEEMREVEKLLGLAENAEIGIDDIPEMFDVDLTVAAPDAMNKLAEKYEKIGKFHPQPKPLLISPLMLKGGTTGIYSPFTLEANINKSVLAHEKPFTACHELAHLSGFMREDEANFIAFLACKESGDPVMMYSGYLEALGFLTDIGFSDDGMTEYDYLAGLSAPTTAILRLENEFWREQLTTTKDSENGDTIMVISPITNAVSAVNDQYLKANGQQDGTESYRRMVDLLLQYYTS
jgi:hypothetical protein